MKKVFLAALGLCLLSIIFAVPAQAAGVTVRVEAYYPVVTTTTVAPDWSVPQTSNTLKTVTTQVWRKMKCDGTDVLDGVGTVRFVGYATNTDATGTRTANRFSVDYGQDSLTSGQAWYQFMWANLPAGQEVKVVDMVQDLNRSVSLFNLRFGVPGQLGAVCGWTANNIPTPDEGFISPRSTPTALATNLRVEVFRYSDGAPLACNTTDFSSRVRVRLYADAAPGLYDFHAHVEDSGVFGDGPNQSGDGMGGRFWEIGWNNTTMPALADGGVGQLAGQVGTIVVSFAGKHGMIHFAQQTAAGQPKNEIFCSLG